MTTGKKTALIFGISGQDGSYLARLLLEKGYRVAGTSRDASMSAFTNLRRLGILDRIECFSASLIDFRSVLQVISSIRPDEIYNLAGQSSVGLSFEQPVETFDSIAIGTINLLEVIRFLDRGTKLYNASSSECFGNLVNRPFTEQDPFIPRSPYAVAKAAAFWQVANYREAYGLFACSGILFNHESPLRPARYVTQKIVQSACRIAAGSRETLTLGNLEIKRDWGWAPEYVEAMWRMLQQDRPEDFIIATGETSSLQEFIDAAFSCVGLDWRSHIRFDPSLLRPSDIAVSAGNPDKAKARLGWEATVCMPEVAHRMVRSCRDSPEPGRPGFAARSKR